MAAPSPNTSSPVTNFSLNANTANNIKALLSDSKWGGALGTGATVYYSFPTSNSNSFWGSAYTSNQSSEIFNKFVPATTAQKNATISAIQSWANVANINIVRVETETSNAVGDIRLANTLADMDATTYAFAYFPALENPIGGDVWINANQPNQSGDAYEVGQNGYHTILHELGHALGLSHPFDQAAKLNATEDTLKYTVMSYSDSPLHEDGGNSSFYPTTPMLLDIQAIQSLYGANNGFNTGNNAYVFNDTSTYYQTIWDAGGIDTIQYTGNSNGIINLNAGTFSTLGQAITLDSGMSQNDNVAIAYNVTIENAIGGNGNDIIYQNSVNNLIDGGAGSDTVVYQMNHSAITQINLRKFGGARITNENDTDTLINIEALNFTDGNFTIEQLIALKSPPTYATNNGAITPLQYTGAVSFLEYQLLGNAAGDVVTGANTNDFINLLGGDDAADGGEGDDVLDGGTGSNFLTGGNGNDTFFLDGRGGTVTWSTITDFSGDEVNIWGWNNGVSKLLLTEENGGVAGFTGATFHYDLNNDSNIDTSITFSGLSTSQVSNPLAQTVADNGYLLIA
jgi:serralysin